MAGYLHEDHPEGTVDVKKAFPQALRDQVVLDSYDNEVRDGDSNAVYSYRYGEHVGEIFDDVSSTDHFEIYPHDDEIAPVLIKRQNNETKEVDFLRDAVLQTLGESPYGELQVRLGCAGCSCVVEFSSEKHPADILQAIREFPYEVKGEGTVWKKSGDMACQDGADCSYATELAAQADQMTRFVIEQQVEQLTQKDN